MQPALCHVGANDLLPLTVFFRGASLCGRMAGIACIVARKHSDFIQARADALKTLVRWRYR